MARCIILRWPPIEIINVHGTFKLYNENVGSFCLYLLLYYYYTYCGTVM